MSIVQSEWAAGRKQAPVSGTAGDVVAERYTFTASAALAANDIIELGNLPAFHTVVDATLISDNLAGTTLDVGLMSGSFGSPDQARTVGNELFAGAAINAVVRASKAAGLLLATTQADRSVGVKLLGAGMTAGQSITVILYTKQ